MEQGPKTYEGGTWISYPEAEKYCGLSHTTLWRYVSSGEIRAARVGRAVRIDVFSLKNFMEGRVPNQTDGYEGLGEGR